jgi:hypothetical protein
MPYRLGNDGNQEVQKKGVLASFAAFSYLPLNALTAGEKLFGQMNIFSGIRSNLLPPMEISLQLTDLQK